MTTDNDGWEIVKGPALKRAPELGTWFTISAKFDKTYHEHQDYGGVTQWKRKPYKKPVKALYVGVRQVYDGWSNEAGWHVMTSHTVWLFVTSAHRNPIHVLPEDVT